MCIFVFSFSHGVVGHLPEELLDLRSSESDKLGFVHAALDPMAICVVFVRMIDKVLAFFERMLNYVKRQ